jgi:aquaporin Z
MGKYITEFIGTFFLVLTVALTGEPLAIGAVLMIMIYAGGHISGAHYNPAVTLAVLIRGKVSFPNAIVYIIVQVAGAAAAAYLAKWFTGDMNVVTLDVDDKKALIAEALGTFALAFVVLNAATSKGTAGNSFYGLAIGFAVFVFATVFGKFSGGAFNPAVAVGASIIKAFAWKNIWIYLAGCFGGAIIAALVFNFMNQDDGTASQAKGLE